MNLREIRTSHNKCLDLMIEKNNTEEKDNITTQKKKNANIFA